MCESGSWYNQRSHTRELRADNILSGPQSFVVFIVVLLLLLSLISGQQ